MRAAAPIVDATGTLLVRQGSELTPEILQRLANRKIEAVDVDTDGGPRTPIPAQAPLPEVHDPAGTLDHAFAPVADNDLMKALHQAAREFHLARRERKV
jgi:hypothetical protein